jgi:hypothetical protein
MRCSYCGSCGHTIAHCPKTWAGSAARASLYCTYCGGRDHDVKGCPRTFAGNAARTWHPDTVADHFVKDKS